MLFYYCSKKNDALFGASFFAWNKYNDESSSCGADCAYRASGVSRETSRQVVFAIVIGVHIAGMIEILLKKYHDIFLP